MEIQVGRYIIKSDPQCMWIEERYIGEDKHGAAKERTRRVSGYMRTFNQLLESFMEQKIRGSKANTVKELLSEFAKAEDDIKAMIKEMTK